uniref:Peptidoglycan recognition protein family domain-containing protein n=1 Tax=Clastoptera arizonana TaxID=38151 RepID=A0A1B6BYP3_9HEMI
MVSCSEHMESCGEHTESTTDLVECQNFNNECNEYINSDLKQYCDLPTAIQNGIVDKLNGDIISVSNSNNIHVGAKIGKVIVDSFTVVTAAKDKKIDYRKRKIIIGVLCSLCSCVVLASLIYFTFLNKNDIEWLVKREGWGAKDAKSPCTESEYKEVVEIVLFQTNTDFCYDFYDCSQIVRNIQDEDLTDVFATDIKYNFLIGGDGKIYQGLDWLCKGEHVFLPFSSIHIGIIGDFRKAGHNNHLSDLQKDALQKLFKYGVETHKLYDKFGISPACCYKNTSDPGENILNEIVHFPEYVRACLHTDNCDYSYISDIDVIMNYTIFDS